jgi:carbon starvation protein
MSSLFVLLLSIVICLSGYMFYGRWLANKWGIDTKMKTPAHRLNDGKDFNPSSKLTVFIHQFSSIAGAGPITGPIIAAVFGWVPVLLWLLIGGIFFGAVQDFAALYASIKEDGKSIGLLIEKYIGRNGKRVFLLFAWLFCLIIIAAFLDIVAGTFNGFGADGSLNQVNGATASISVLCMFVAVIFGYFTHKFKLLEYQKVLIGLFLILAMCFIGINFPFFLSKQAWSFVILAYMFVASMTPMWLLKEPRDFLSSFLLFGVIIASVLGILFLNPKIELSAFNGFTVNGKFFFPFLFVTIACGAVSGFHSLVSSGTSSKILEKEEDMLCVGYGAMMVECILAVVSLLIAGSLASNGVLPKGTPFQVFSAGVGSFLGKFGLSANISNSLIAMSISTFALTTLDAVGRIARMSFMEFFSDGNTDNETNLVKKFLTNQYFAIAITLLLGYLLCLGGYLNVWPLFGAANQLCSALVLIVLLVFLKSTKRMMWTLVFPAIFMFFVTFISLILSINGIFEKIFSGNFAFLTDGLQLIVAISLLVLASSVAYLSVKKIQSMKTA